MKTALLLGLLVLFNSEIFAQQKLKFTYDTAGNQIVRDRVCATCKGQAPQVEDSIATLADISEEELGLGIVAYPNPVTNLLFIDWYPDPELEPNSLQLYSIDSRLMASFTINQGQMQQQIDFQKLPPGLYLLNVGFKNGSRRSFKVLRS